MKTVGLIQTFAGRSGGNIYRQQVLEVLRETYRADWVGFGKPFQAFWNQWRLRDAKEVWIHDFYSIIFLRKRQVAGKHIALIFHVDFSGFPLLPKLAFTILEKVFFYRSLKKADALVVISEYWKQHFERRGYKSIYKAYCGFDLKEFEFGQEEVEDFKKKYGLGQKPVVYIGNCQKAKGVVEAYQALKDLDVTLVTSGKKEVDIPAMNLNVGRREYLLLLKIASVAVTMSRFKEGWCMTAHEAMLCKTPVIGSGAGGMRELLEGGGQTIATRETLKEKITHLLQNPVVANSQGEQGYQYAVHFTKERFNQAWATIIHDVINR